MLTPLEAGRVHRVPRAPLEAMHKTDNQLKAIVRRESNIMDDNTWNGDATDPLRHREAQIKCFAAMDQLEARGYKWYIAPDTGEPNQNQPFRWRR